MRTEPGRAARRPSHRREEADLDRIAIDRAEIGATAQVFKMWRELADLSQRELAHLARIHYTTISDYETGKTVPHAETVARVSAALGMTTADREEAESYVRRTCPRLRPTALVGTDPPGLPSSAGEFAALVKQIEKTAQEVCQHGFRLIVLLVDLLIRIDGRVIRDAGYTKPDTPREESP